MVRLCYGSLRPVRTIPNQDHTSLSPGGWKESLDRLVCSRSPADFASCASLVRLCGTAKALSGGKRIHDHLIRVGLAGNLFLGSQLVQMYGKCGAVDETLALFAIMPQHNVFSFNFVMGVYIQQKQCLKALQLFNQMLQEAIVPNNVTFITLLAAYASRSALHCAKQTHTRIPDSLLASDVILGTTLVNMYGNCGSVEDARKIFDKLPERNVISWTAMIAVYTKHGQDKEPLRLFNQMQREGVMPDKITFVNILTAFANEEMLVEGRRVHVLILKSGFESDVIVGNTLVNLYNKCGSLKDAQMMFCKMSKRDVVSWTAMIDACVEHGVGKEAFHLFKQMQEGGVLPDKVTFISILAAYGRWATLAEAKQMHIYILNKGYASDIIVRTALVNMYGKCGSLEDAKSIFDMMLMRDIVVWNTMIAVYAQHGHAKEAIRFFEQMQQDETVVPDEVTFVSMLDACASEAALDEGKHIHSLLQNSGFKVSVTVWNALINVYGKCGSLEDAQRVFDNMPDHNVISWTTIIVGYAQHGEGKRALQLFFQMHNEGLTPDEITFLSILAACSHSGLVAEGCKFFTCMTRDYGLSPSVDHYACMVDLLGRAGRLDEAEHYVNSMPFQPTVGSHMALLGACRHQADVNRGVCTAKQVLELDPEMAASSVMLSNLQGEDVAKGLKT